MTKILVCGGRDYHDDSLMEQVLDQIQPGEIIHGGARGADRLAGEYARQRGIPCREYPAQWNRYGKSAGYRRNEQMLREGHPDLVVAFPGGRGTAHMINTAREQGYPVEVIAKGR